MTNDDKKDITELFSKCQSKIIQNAIKKNQKIWLFLLKT